MEISEQLKTKLIEAEAIIWRAIEAYKPYKIFSLLSGGHDSLTATALADKVLGYSLDGVRHINTGIGIKATQQFVIDVCLAMDWDLKIYHAAENTKADGSPDPQIYEDIVVKHGFPGPGAHRFMYSKLKERQIRRLVRENKSKRSDKVMLISGVRSEESSRRMGNVKEVTVSGAQVWVSPMMHFTESDQAEMMRAFNLPRNPVKDKLCMSGECLCGAFAQKGELAEIEIWYPEDAKRIRDIESKVFAAGHKKNWESGTFTTNGDPSKDGLMMCIKCEDKFLSLTPNP